MRRRKFIWLSAASAAISALPWLASCTSTSKWTAVLAIPSTLGNFCDQPELMAMGKTYIEWVPDESTTSALENLILLNDDGRGTYEPGSEESLREFITRKADQDFNMDQTVILKGWVISKTEARQCALYFLTQNS